MDSHISRFNQEVKKNSLHFVHLLPLLPNETSFPQRLVDLIRFQQNSNTNLISNIILWKFYGLNKILVSHYGLIRNY